MYDNNQEPASLLTPVIETSVPPKGVWKFWPTFGLGMAIFGLHSVVQVWVALIFIIINVVSVKKGLLEEAFSRMTTNGQMFAVAVIASAVVGLGFIVLFVHIRKGPSLTDYLGLKRPSRRSLIVVPVLAVIMIGFLLLSLQLQDTQNTDITTDLYQTSVWPVLFGIAAVIFAPAFEESFFRGFLFAGFKQSRIGATGTIIFTSLWWAVLHIQYDLFNIAIIFGLGIFLGIVRLKTGSLWSALFLHGLWNLIAVIASAI